MPNEVTIIVKSRNETKPIFDQVRREASQLGRDAGRNISTEMTVEITRQAGSRSGGFGQVGEQIGETVGRSVGARVAEHIRRSVGSMTSRISDRFRGGGGDTSGARSGGIGDSLGRVVGDAVTGRNRVHVDVDVDRPGLFQRFLGLGKELGGKLGQGLMSTLSGIMSGDFISMILKGLSVTALVGTLAPVLGAAINSAVLVGLGGGVIGAGIAAAFKDPEVKAAFGEFKETVAREFENFGQAFKPGVLRFFDRLESDIGPQMKPMIEQLKETFGPLTEDLGDGLIGFLQNALPAITRAAEAAAPLLDTLAESLPSLGEDLGYFFDQIAESGPEANVFFNDLLNAIGWIIRRIGDMINFFAHAYDGIRDFWIDVARFAIKAFGTVLQAAATGLGWIPGLGPKLKQAEKDFANFSKNANESLDAIQDEDVTINIRQVIRTVGRLVAGAALDVVDIINKGKKPRGSATGGNVSGLTWVGEHGPELLDAPAGSRVMSAGDSARMASGGQGGGGPIVTQVFLDGRMIAEAIADPIRNYVGNRFGGDVQLAYGR